MTTRPFSGAWQRFGSYTAVFFLSLLLVAAVTACGSNAVSASPAVPTVSAADITGLIESGAYDDALTAISQAQLTEEERTALAASRYLAMAHDAEAAGDASSAYGHYISAGASAEAVDGAARCYADMTVNKARALFENGDIYGAYALLDTLKDHAYADTAVLARSELDEKKSEKLAVLYTQYRDRLAAGAWYTAMLGQQSLLTGDARYDLTALPQTADAVYGGTFGLFYRTGDTLHVYGDTLGAKETVESLSDVVDCAVAQNHALILTADGTVHVVGSIAMEKGLTEEWSAVTDVAAGAYHSVCLNADGTAAAAGSNLHTQCDVAEWTNVTQIAAGLYHTVGLKQDGTCVATGDNTYGQCDVSAWTDVIAVYCGANHTVALTKDFTVLAAGDNASGQCEVSDWKDIIAVSCGVWHTVGVRADGQVAVSGADSNGQCQVSDWRMFDAASSPEPIPVHTGGTATELVDRGEYRYGPWLYLSQNGAVMICFDLNELRAPLRSDLYSVSGTNFFGGFADGEEEPGSSRLPAELCRGNDAVFGITGDYLNFGYNPDGLQIRRGQVYCEGGPQESMAFFPDGTMRLLDPAVTTAQDLLDAGVQDSWAFGPVILRDGEIAVEDINAHFLDEYATPRCAIGMIVPYHFVSVVSGWGGQLKMVALGEIFQHYGAVVAYNMDGGNSTSVVFMGEMLNYVAYVRSIGSGIRKLCDMVMFIESDLVPGVDDKYEMNRFIAGKP